jgi:tetratricopeptide (TPR) repeat protein
MQYFKSYYKTAFLFLFLIFCSPLVFAQARVDKILVMPFENTSDKPEFNWVAESFANSLTQLLKVPNLEVVTSDERRLAQERLRLPLTALPSLATTIKIARESRANLLVIGEYEIISEQNDVAASLKVKAQVIKVNEGKFFDEETTDGRRIFRKIDLADALANLQTIQGQLAYQILYQRDKALPFAQRDFIERANKIPTKAFEAYIKGLLIPETNDTRENYFKNALRLYAEVKGGEVYADAALELAHHYYRKNDYQNAIEYFARIPREDPLYPEAAFYTSILHFNQGNYEPALGTLRSLAEGLKITSVYNNLGAFALIASRSEKNAPKKSALLNEAVEYLKQAAESSPNDSSSLFNYGYALFLTEKYTEVINQMRPVLVIDQRDGQAYFLLAKALEKNNDPTAAEWDNKARLHFPNYAKTQTEWERSKTISEISPRIQMPARKDFATVLRIMKTPTITPTPVDEGTALLQRAKKLYQEGKDDEAIQILQKLLLTEPMSAEGYLLLGSIYLRRGDIEKAVSQLKTALFWNNKLIEANILLGRIFLERGDCAQSRLYAKTAMEIDPNNQEAIALQRQTQRQCN